MPKDSIKPLLLGGINSNTLDAVAWNPINVDGLDGPCFSLRIFNSSSQPVTISYDGATEHDYLPDDETMTINFQFNSRADNHVALLPKGTKVYVRGTAGTGFIYLSGWYQN